MRSFFTKQTIVFVVLSLLCSEVALARLEPWIRFKKQAISFVKDIFKESKKSEISAEVYDEYPPVYDIPSSYGHGYDVHGYSPHGHEEPIYLAEPTYHVEESLSYNHAKPSSSHVPAKPLPYDKKPKYHEEIRYDEAVNVEQGKKMWSGKIVIPNFLRGTLDDLYSLHDQHVVKGTDNRIGFRVALPFLGDFQYLREIGPGKYTDSLGPGRFKYPGINDKRAQEAAKDHYKHIFLEANAPAAHYDATNLVSGSSGGPYSKSFDIATEEDPNKPDPLASLKNYPWYR